jgi:hypothetical protein
LKLTAPPVGTEPGTVVLVAAGRGVIVGVGPFGVLVGEGVIEAGAPSATLIESSTKPGGTGVETTVLELPPQLSIIDAATRKRTGEITSHRNHRDIVMTLPMRVRGVKAGADSEKNQEESDSETAAAEQSNRRLRGLRRLGRRRKRRGLRPQRDFKEKMKTPLKEIRSKRDEDRLGK